jgi:hypothetical protein
MDVRRLKPYSYLHAVMHMLLPRTARLFGCIKAEAFSIKPEVILGQRFIRSHQDHSFL